MDHVAIMDPKQGLISKILSGEKTIESRWYKMRVAPWGRIGAGDVVYFKESGKPVTAKAKVATVQQCDHPTEAELVKLIAQYGGSPGICGVMEPREWLNWAKERPYVVLVFLKEAEVVQPFLINKTGFGSACAWLSVGDINRVRLQLADKAE